MLQLLGGVAVAGAVAAGSTAFTANGIQNTISGSTFLGGSVSQSVTGANLTAMSATTSDAPTNRLVTAFDLTFDGNTPAGRTVTLTSDGTISAGSPTGFYCETVQANKHSVCTAGTSLVAPGGSYTDITSVTVSVA
jgi:hypothetical protein